MFKAVNVTTQENTCDAPLGDQTKGNEIDHPSTYAPPLSSNPLHIENPPSDAMFHLPKTVIRKNVI
jgi:hypothetical protein